MTWSGRGFDEEKDEVVRRAIALAIVGVKGEAKDQEIVRTLINHFGAEGFLTPAEQAFVDDPNPSERDRVNFAWRYEGFHVMLWALGLIPDLGPRRGYLR